MPEEYTLIERHVLLTWWLCSGDRLTTEQVARRLGVTVGTAAKMFNRISRKLPIFRDMYGRWRKLP